MKTLSWLAIATLVAGASLVACGSDDDDDNKAGSGGGTATGGTGGSAGAATGGTGGSAGAATGGTGGTATGGSAGESGGAGGGGEPLCADVCAESLCADPKVYTPSAECSKCALVNGQTSCMSELGPCFANDDCGALVTCLLDCSSGAGGSAGEGGGAGAGGSSTDACTGKCIMDNQTGWVVLVDTVAPCICE
jgi:hypothetical protein